MESKILIVDDEPLVLEMFEVVLRELGYQTTSTTSALKAKEFLKTKLFDLIVVDVWLENDDGFILAQYARKVQPQIEVIVITGRPSKKGVEKAVESHFEYLSKPVSFKALQVTVEKMVNKSDDLFKTGLKRIGSSLDLNNTLDKKL